MFHSDLRQAAATIAPLYLPSEKLERKQILGAAHSSFSHPTWGKGKIAVIGRSTGTDLREINDNECNASERVTDYV